MISSMVRMIRASKYHRIIERYLRAGVGLGEISQIAEICSPKVAMAFYSYFNRVMEAHANSRDEAIAMLETDKGMFGKFCDFAAANYRGSSCIESVEREERAKVIAAICDELNISVSEFMALDVVSQGYIASHEDPVARRVQTVVGELRKVGATDDIVLKSIVDALSSGAQGSGVEGVRSEKTVGD
ncbi:hypothetical protein [Nitratidesulfovibrio sp.]|uniref:hypothetical protein n=1 Tax=Nitratidesulfovibrio sp. TaxID=2802297 RepID=UPI0033429002